MNMRDKVKAAQKLIGSLDEKAKELEDAMFTPSRLVLLKEIGSCLLQSIAWYEPLVSIESSLKYVHQAEVLVEVLEVHDCGSIGGFDAGMDKMKSYNLFERYEWLYKKHDDPEKDNNFLEIKKLLEKHNERK